MAICKAIQEPNFFFPIIHNHLFSQLIHTIEFTAIYQHNFFASYNNRKPTWFESNPQPKTTEDAKFDDSQKKHHPRPTKPVPLDERIEKTTRNWRKRQAREQTISSKRKTEAKALNQRVHRQSDLQTLVPAMDEPIKNHELPHSWSIRHRRWGLGFCPSQAKVWREGSDFVCYHYWGFCICIYFLV